MCSFSFWTGLVCTDSHVLTHSSCSESMEMHMVACYPSVSTKPYTRSWPYWKLCIPSHPAVIPRREEMDNSISVVSAQISEHPVPVGQRDAQVWGGVVWGNSLCPSSYWPSLVTSDQDMPTMKWPNPLQCWGWSTRRWCAPLCSPPPDPGAEISSPITVSSHCHPWEEGSHCPSPLLAKEGVFPVFYYFSQGHTDGFHLNAITIWCCVYITKLTNNSSSVRCFKTNISILFSLWHFLLLLNREYFNRISDSAISSLYIPLQRDTEIGDETGKEFYQVSLSPAACHSLNGEYVSSSGLIPALHSDLQKNNKNSSSALFFLIHYLFFFYVQYNLSPSCICM